MFKDLIEKSDPAYEIKTASGKSSFIKTLHDFHPDLIISDFEVPGFNAIRLLEYLEIKNQAIPVIILSDNEDRNKCLESLDKGAFDFIQKKDIHKLPYLLKKIRTEVLPENSFQKNSKHKFDDSRYEILVNSLNEGIFLISSEKFKIIDVNKSVCDMYGYTREEILDLGFEYFSAVDLGYTQEKAREKAHKALQDEKVTMNWVAKRKDGINFWIQISIKRVIVEGTEYLLAIVKNIDEEVKVRESLEMTTKHYESLAQNTPDIIMRFDRSCRHLYVNNAVKEQLEVDPSFFLGRTHEEMGIFPENMCKFWEESIHKVFESSLPNIVYFTLDTPNGEVNIEWRLFPEFNAEGKVETVLAISRDITERVRQDKIQRVLFEIANAANNTRNLQELFLTIQKSLNVVIDTKNCYVALYDKETDKITLPFHRDEKDSFKEIPAGKTITAYVIKTGKSQLVDATRVEELKKKGEIDPVGTPAVSWLGVPLKIADKIIGVFVVQSYNEEVRYTDDDVQLLEFVSDQIARAIERKLDQDNLNRNEKRQRMIFESSPDGLVVIGLQGEILEFNSKFCDLTNTGTKDIGSMRFFDLIPDPDVIKVQNILNDTLTSGYSRNIEFSMKKSGGEDFYAEASMGLISGDENLEDTFIIVIKNITDRKQYERNLRIAKDKAEESDRLKTAFLSNMSHEIRTPMNAIVGFAELMSSNEGTGEEKQEFITQINQAADSLLRLIDDIIDISQIESGQLVIHKTNFSLSPMLNKMKPLFDNLLKQQGKDHIELTEVMDRKRDDIVLYTDELRLKQIFMNLVSNAIKFTDTGKISYGIKDKSTENITFFVKDTGIGISSSRQKYIFERFRQGHENKKYFYGGTGLGLAISKSLIEQMGGSIKVISSVGKGSEFIFTLPCCSDKKKEKIKFTGTDFPEDINWKDKTILIAEDEDSNFVLIKEILKSTGVNILRAKDGVEAVRMVKIMKDIDLVLMDIQMPGINGYEATREIRKMNIKLPIIAQTAYAMAGEREISQKEGCNDYIAKPLRADELIQIIGKFLDDQT